jgi:hypothetical protein
LTRQPFASTSIFKSNSRSIHTDDRRNSNNRQAFHAARNNNTAIAKLEPFQLLPDWVKVQRRNQPERIVRDRLQAQLGGKLKHPRHPVPSIS